MDIHTYTHILSKLSQALTFLTYVLGRQIRISAGSLTMQNEFLHGFPQSKESRDSILKYSMVVSFHIFPIHRSSTIQHCVV
jgi:hypothetical protein